MLDQIRNCPSDSDSLLVLDKALQKNDQTLPTLAAVFEPFLREADMSRHALGVVYLLYVCQLSWIAFAGLRMHCMTDRRPRRRHCAVIGLLFSGVFFWLPSTPY